MKYFGIIRKKDGTKVKYDIGNVETIKEAREALLSVPDAKVAMVVVPPIIKEKEAA